VESTSRELIAVSENDLPAVVRELLVFAGGRKKFALSGDLGAGKTALAKAFCHHLGVKQIVASPTYPIVNDYTFQDGAGEEQTIHHLDLYRLRNLEEAYGIGIEDYLDDDCYALIEWPELIESLLPEDIVHIKIFILPNSSRKILFLST